MEACEALLGNARRLHEAAVQELEATRARQAQLFAELGRTVAAVRVKVSAARAAVQDAVDREAAVDDVMKAATVRAAALGACRSEVEAAIEACGGRGVDVTTVGEEEKVVILDAWRCVDVELEEEPAGIHKLVEVSVHPAIRLLRCMPTNHSLCMCCWISALPSGARKSVGCGRRGCRR